MQKGYHEIEVLTEAFRRAVQRRLVKRELFSEEQAHSMLSWPHSGFHVHPGVRFQAEDVLGILQMARYAARAPIALERLCHEASKGQVTVLSEKREGPTAGAHTFPVLEFLAMLLSHLPERHEIQVRQHGAYSVIRWRGGGARGFWGSAARDQRSRGGGPQVLGSTARTARGRSRRAIPLSPWPLAAKLCTIPP